VLVESLGAVRLDRGKRLLATFVIDVAQREFRPALGEGLRQNAAEALGCAGNQDDLVFEIEHCVSGPPLQ